MPREQKELRFFDRDQNFRQGLDHYSSQFGRWTREAAVGEASPPYFFKGITFDAEGNHRFNLLDDAPGRIAQTLPDVRIVMTLRNPVDRSYSQFWKGRAQKTESSSTYRNALEEELDGERTPANTAGCWIYKNRYSLHLRRWLELYPASSCRILIFEEWIADPTSMLSELAAFLEIDPEGMPNDFPVLNVGIAGRYTLSGRIRKRLQRAKVRRFITSAPDQPSYQELEPETRRFAQKVFQEDIEDTERILGRSLGLWKDT